MNAAPGQKDPLFGIDDAGDHRGLYVLLGVVHRFLRKRFQESDIRNQESGIRKT
jgi:hypothetical protein